MIFSSVFRSIYIATKRFVSAYQNKICYYSKVGASEILIVNFIANIRYFLQRGTCD